MTLLSTYSPLTPSFKTNPETVNQTTYPPLASPNTSPVIMSIQHPTVEAQLILSNQMLLSRVSSLLVSRTIYVKIKAAWSCLILSLYGKFLTILHALWYSLYFFVALFGTPEIKTTVLGFNIEPLSVSSQGCRVEAHQYRCINTNLSDCKYTVEHGHTFVWEFTGR